MDAGPGAAVDSVTVDGTSAEDAITVSALNAGSISVAVNSRGLITIQNATLASTLTINAGEGADLLSITPSGATNFALTVNAGGPNNLDQLVINGDLNANVFTYAPSATVNSAGTVTVDGESVAFTGAESILLTGLGDRKSVV